MIRFLIIGFGRMGRIHYNAIKRLADADVAGIADPTYNDDDIPEPVYRNFQDACNSFSYDACIISSPTNTHADYGAECIKKRVPVMIEKPVTRTLMEARQLEKLQNEYGSPVFVSFTERFHPVIQATLPELRKSMIREMSFTRIVQPSRNILSDGLLQDISVHDIDLAGFLSGKVINGHSIREKHTGSGQHYEISLTLDNDIPVQIHSATDNFLKIRQFTIQTENAVFEGDLLAKTLIKKTGKSEFMIPIDSAIDAAQRQLSDMIGYLKSGKRNHLADLQDGIRTLGVIGA